MEELKFRVWVDRGVMLGPFDLSQDPQYWAHKLEDGDRMMYTGIKDKNGVDIYKGDILDWDEKEWGAPHKEVVTASREQLYMRDTDWPKFVEVIGNIYEGGG